MSAVSPDSAPHLPSAAGSASAPLSLTFVKLVTSLTCLSVSRVVARSHNSIMPQIGKGEEGEAEASERGKDGGKASHHSGRQTKFSRGSKLENCFFPPHGPSERVSPTTKHSGHYGPYLGNELKVWSLSSQRIFPFCNIASLKKGQCGALSPFSASLFSPSFASILLPPFE